MYGQPNRRDEAREKANGVNSAASSGANPYAPAAPDDFMQYAPAGTKHATSPPPPNRSQNGLYRPSPFPNQAPQQDAQQFAPQQSQQQQHDGIYPSQYAPTASSAGSPTLSSLSSTAPSLPPSAQLNLGYGQSQHLQQQPQHLQQPQRQTQHRPQHGQSQQPVPQSASSFGGGYAQHPQHTQQQQPQQHFYQPDEAQRAQHTQYQQNGQHGQYQQNSQQAQYLQNDQHMAAQQSQYIQQPANPFQSAQGIALQFGAAQMMAGIANQFGGGGSPQTTNGMPSMPPGLGPQMLESFGVPNYFANSASGGIGDASSFMRVPKHYFAVNHSYVLRKLVLLLMPFQRRSWSRLAGVDQRQFERQGSDNATSFLPPRDDVNAPDLYIPVMAFVSYVLLVGFVFGTRGMFTAEVLAKYFSKGFGVLTLEVLVIKLGLYLISAQQSPWLDVIAYRGYKFVGVIVAMISDLVFPRLYYPVLLYTAFAMAVFLMRSHRKIILPGGSERQSPADLPQRNAFLLGICALQFPIYWLLILDAR